MKPEKKTMYQIVSNWDLGFKHLVFETKGDAMEYLQQIWPETLGSLEEAIFNKVVSFEPLEVYRSTQNGDTLND
jgi:hypothetical protein